MSYRASMIGGSLQIAAEPRRRHRGRLPVSARTSRSEGVMTHDGHAGATGATSTACFVVDDHPIVRQGLALLINQEPDLMVCGEAEEAHAALAGDRALEARHRHRRYFAQRPGRPRSAEEHPARDARLPVLILSMHDESIYAERALRAGANGYIMKQEATEKVLVAMRRILGGRNLRERPHREPDAAAIRRAARRPRAVAARRPERSRAGSVPPDRRRARHPRRSPKNCTSASRRSSPTRRTSRKSCLCAARANCVQHAIQWSDRARTSSTRTPTDPSGNP